MSDKDKDKDDVQVQPFAAFLQKHARGATHDDASLALHKLTKSVLESGKAGKLTLNVEVKPVGKGSDKQVVVTAGVVVKEPTAKSEESFFFVDKQGNLTRDDPQQPMLPLAEVPRDDSEAKAVNR